MRTVPTPDKSTSKFLCVTVLAILSWNPFWTPGWPCIHRGPLASASRVLVLKAWTTKSGNPSEFLRNSRKIPAEEHPTRYFTSETVEATANEVSSGRRDLSAATTECYVVSWNRQRMIEKHYGILQRAHVKQRDTITEPLLCIESPRKTGPDFI
ncbi:uncharacterized protein LOC143272564 isoform X2 [Peromyscus maniculatus bairdii]|uniref:uncharacterized protein LOC143272564 isoform X2 n=1 Tax=Peromyscus maniculatus bairdii TaxID=230844 RepID=UPI003FD01B42